MTLVARLGLSGDQLRVAESMDPVVQGGEHDIWGLYRDPSLTEYVTQQLALPFREQAIDAVVGGEARGFVLGPLVAKELGAAFLPARKSRSYLPGEILTSRSQPDWEGKQVEFSMQRHAIQSGARILVVDDWYTTGNQGRAIAELVEMSKGELVGTSVIVEEYESCSAADGLGEFVAMLHWERRSNQFRRSTYALTS